MAKDPAVLWYWNDWQGGTVTMSRHLKGCYMDLLHAQFNGGRLSLAQIKTVLGGDFGQSWPCLQGKFKEDESGNYYNEKAEKEKQKRQKYTESRRRNLEKPHMDVHMDSHMENENENSLSTTLNNKQSVEKNEISDRLNDPLKTETGASKEDDGETKDPKTPQGNSGVKADTAKPIDGLTLFSNFDKLHDVLKLEETWIENTAKHHKLTVSGTLNKIAEWVAMFKTQGEDRIALKEAKSYCANWIGKNKNNQPAPESNRAYKKIIPQT